jgi:hypothetical protein
MTEDDDRVAYLAGDDVGAIDDTARADLDELRSLLADEALWATPPAALEDAVVATITAEAARQPVADAPVARPQDERTTSTGEVVSLADRRRHRLRFALSAAAAVVALAVAGVVVLRSGDDAIDTTVALEATEVLPGASGTAHVQRTDSGWRIELDATGLPRLDGGRFYQGWLRSEDGQLVPIGTFNEGADVVLWAGVSPADFPTLTVTEEAADGDQASSGVRVLVGTIVLP